MANVSVVCSPFNLKINPMWSLSCSVAVWFSLSSFFLLIQLISACWQKPLIWIRCVEAVGRLTHRPPQDQAWDTLDHTLRTANDQSELTGCHVWSHSIILTILNMELYHSTRWVADGIVKVAWNYLLAQHDHFEVMSFRPRRSRKKNQVWGGVWLEDMTSRFIDRGPDRCADGA